MQRDPRAFLWNVRDAALAIQSFTADLDANSYATNALVQAGDWRSAESASLA